MLRKVRRKSNFAQIETEVRYAYWSKNSSNPNSNTLEPDLPQHDRPAPVLSPSSILPPLSPHWASTPTRKDINAFQKCYFLQFILHLLKLHNCKIASVVRCLHTERFHMSYTQSARFRPRHSADGRTRLPGACSIETLTTFRRGYKNNSRPSAICVRQTKIKQKRRQNWLPKLRAGISLLLIKHLHSLQSLPHVTTLNASNIGINSQDVCLCLCVYLCIFCGKGLRSRSYGRTAALSLIVQHCDEDD
jgi:hypothetical protein